MYTGRLSFADETDDVGGDGSSHDEPPPESTPTPEKEPDTTPDPDTTSSGG